MRLLLIEDDASLAQTATNILTRQGYIVDVASDGQLGWAFAQSYNYNLLLLDVILPHLDGVSLCQKLRQAGDRTPILLLTARDSQNDKIAGLDAGADDYVIKPFDWPELLARIRALLRRDGTPWMDPTLTWGLLQLNSITCEVNYGGKALSLRPREYKLLDLFLRNPNRVFSCSAILEHLWSSEGFPSEDTVRAHIKGLRQKLKVVGAEEVIETIYGLGYRLKPVAPHPVFHDAASVESQPVSSTKLDALQQALEEAWLEVKPDVLQQIQFIEQAVCRLQDGQLEPELQDQAIAIAHKLAGTVGSFGFAQSSQAARQIETLLQLNPLPPEIWMAVAAQIRALHNGLHVPAFQDSSLSVQATSTVAPTLLRNPTRLLAVDDDPHILTALTALLEPWGLNLTTLADPLQFWSVLEDIHPDLLLLDIAMPQLNGLDLCQKLRQMPRWASLPIVFLTAHTDSEMIEKVFTSGADDFVSKPIVAPELVRRIIMRVERNRFWRQLVERDRLTQLLNREQFMENWVALLQQTKQGQQSVALAALKLRSLQTINQHYGYAAGDQLLRQTGHLLQNALTSHEYAARWSGSTFMISFYAMAPVAAKRRLAQLIELLNHRSAAFLSQDVLPLNITTGMVQYPKDSGDPQVLCQRLEQLIG